MDVEWLRIYSHWEIKKVCSTMYSVSGLHCRYIFPLGTSVPSKYVEGETGRKDQEAPCKPMASMMLTNGNLRRHVI